MRARSALFDVYGDLLAERGHRATIAGLVRLLDPVGIAAPAVRTAVSRMVAQGWLEPTHVGSARGYAATPQGVDRLRQASERIYRRRAQEWDGTWQLLFVSSPGERTARSQLRRELTYLGYGPLADGVWIAPRINPETGPALARTGCVATRAEAVRFNPPEAPLTAWDLPALATAYDEWLREQRTHCRPAFSEQSDREAFARRFHLVHEWRKLLFTDPGLPPDLLPGDWPGTAAAEFFSAHAQALRPAADRFVSWALETDRGHLTD